MGTPIAEYAMDGAPGLLWLVERMFRTLARTDEGDCGEVFDALGFGEG